MKRSYRKKLGPPVDMALALGISGEGYWFKLSYNGTSLGGESRDRSEILDIFEMQCPVRLGRVRIGRDFSSGDELVPYTFDLLHIMKKKGLVSENFIDMNARIGK